MNNPTMTHRIFKRSRSLSWALVSFLGCICRMLLLPLNCCDAFNVASRTFFHASSVANIKTTTVLSLTTPEEDIIEIDVDATTGKSDSLHDYDYYTQKLQELVSITSRDDSAVSVALDTFDEMFRQYIIAEDPNLLPDIRIYNKVLQICAYSSNATAIDTMEQIMQRTADDQANDVSYSIFAEGYLQRHQFSKVIDLIDELRANKPQVLTTTVLNKLIKGYGQTRQPERALETLESMLEQSANEISHPVFPNRKSWVHVLRAYAVSDDALKEKQCRILWERMKDYHPELDTQMYNAYLQGLADHPKVAEKTLYEMIASRIVPNEESFFYVLRALRKSKDTQGLSFKAEQLLNLQKSFDMPITDRVKSMVIAVMARDSRDTQKAKKARKLFGTMDSPTNFAITQVLKACSSMQGNAEDKAQAFQIAQEVFETSIPEHKDCSIIVEYLRAVANLIELRKQDTFVSHVFGIACREGIVNNAILQQFQRTASEQLVLKTLGGFVEDGIQMPVEWSQNVIER